MNNMNLNYDFSVMQPLKRLAVNPAVSENNEEKVKSFFRHLTAKARENWKISYEKLLAIENDTFQPGVYPVAHKLSGKPKPYPAKMPTMKKYYEKGLEWLMEVMKELGEL